MSTGNFYDSKHLIPNNQELDYFRTLLNEWSEKIPHHSYGKLGEASKIVRVEHMPCHIVRIDAQLEARSVKHYREPYKWQVTPGSLPNFSNLWSLALHSPEEYQSGSHKFTFGGPLETCEHCRGKGKENCSSCSAKGKRKCSSCSGSGEKDCSHCYGTLKMNCSACSATGSVTNSCRNCYGRGTTFDSKTCYACNGSGRITERCYHCNNGKVRCDNLYCRFGKVTCGRCSGSGKQECTKCSGTGSISCSKCKGVGQFIKYAVVSQELIHKKVQKTVHSKSLDKYSAFEPVRSQSSSTRPIYQINREAVRKNLNTGYEPIENAYTSLIQHLASSQQHLRYHDLNIYEVDCYILECNFKGQDFEMAVYGNDNKIMDYNSPIENLKVDHYDSGRKYFEQNHFLESYEQLKLASEMDLTKENKYKNAFQMVRSHIFLAYTFGVLIGLLISFYFLPLEFSILKSINTSGKLPSNTFPYLFFFTQCILMVVAAYGINYFIIAKKKLSIKRDIHRVVYGTVFTVGTSLFISISFLIIYWLISKSI